MGSVLQQHRQLISYSLNGEKVTLSYQAHSFSSFSVLVTTDAQFGTEHSVSYATEWKGFYTPPLLRSVPVSTVICNHDTRVGTEGTMRYYRSIPNPYHAKYPGVRGTSNRYRYGDVLFVNFDSTMSHASDVYGVAKRLFRQIPMQNGLSAVHDLYGSTDTAVSTESTVLFKSIFELVFNEFNFDVVFTGHSHSYCRSHQMRRGKIVLDDTDVKASPTRRVSYTPATVVPATNMTTAKKSRSRHGLSTDMYPRTVFTRLSVLRRMQSR